MDEHLLEVYLINTARHTEETPVAEWVSLPTDAETMKAVFERLGIDGSDTEQYQVSAFHSSLDGWSEDLKPGESLDDLNYLAALLTQRSDEERDKFAAAAQYGDHAASAADLINLTHNLDCYWLYPTVHNSDDYGHYLIDDLDELELPDAAKRFFDYKSYGREAVKEDRGIFTDYGYVYNNGNDYAEWYKANQVPQEYRLTAQPGPSEIWMSCRRARRCPRTNPRASAGAERHRHAGQDQGDHRALGTGRRRFLKVRGIGII